MVEIIPAILPESDVDLKNKIESLPRGIDLFHLDVLEEDYSTKFDKPFEVHLMVENPEALMNRWLERRAKRIIVHQLTPDILKHRGRVDIGLGVNLETPIEEIARWVDDVDFVHLMSIVEIGEQGHPLDERIFDRIKEVKRRFIFKPVSVDGGITASNYKDLIEAGADRLVVGSHFEEVWTSQMKR